MTQSEPKTYKLRVADLPQRTKTRFDLRLDAAEIETLRAALDLLDLRKAVFSGTVSPLGKRDWQLVAHLGATVVQPCVATLEPVTTRVETDVTRQFLDGLDQPNEPEAEMPDDDTSEALGTHIDLWQVLSEALSLALPLYPRAASASEPVEIRVTTPGAQAMTDEQAKPFAGLAVLKDQLKGSDDGS